MSTSTLSRPLLELIGLIFRDFKQPGAFGFDAYATAEDVTHGLHCPHLTAIITGASSGLGLETARVLAARGVNVVMAVRNTEAGEAARRSIVGSIVGANVRVMKLDVSSLQSVRSFCAAFKSETIPLNILIMRKYIYNWPGAPTCPASIVDARPSKPLSLGMLGGPFQLSHDGIELNFATNYLGHYLLTELLLPTMIETARVTRIEGRIVNVSSQSHHFASVRDLSPELLNSRARYRPYQAYARSKLASILHANELARRLKEQGANVTANSAHPGIILTNIVRYSPSLALAKYLERFVLFFLKTIPQGAATQCFLALHPSVKGVSGKYFQNCSFSSRSDESRDPEVAQQLWEFTEELILSMKID